MAPEDPAVRRDRLMATIRRYRPMSVWGQLVVLLFIAAMVSLIASVSELRHAPSGSLYVSCALLIALFFVAMNAMRAQRQLSALVEVVVQDLGKP
jgi:CHASE2 domain-containing sensor protein